MVNFGLNSASILGIFLAVAGAGLYFLRTIRPELSRDHDIFFAAVGLLCGFILLFQGWRLDPILQFGQFLLTGSTIFFAVETLRLRGLTYQEAKRNTPMTDDVRPVSKVYRQAELDELEPYEEDIYEKRRLRGTQDPRPTRRSSYETEDPRSVRTRGTSEAPPSRSRPPRTSRPRPSSPPPTDRYSERYGEWEDTSSDGWESPPRPSATRPRRPRPDVGLDEPVSRPTRPTRPTRPRNPRPSSPDYSSPRNTENVREDYADYVDYEPIDSPEEPEPRNRPEDTDEPNLGSTEY
ncbi:Ycf66 family protein [Oscillatoria salina]|uniref:Ycf66 family protein n=1 Tax=Oscillatoria salina TaxID=331517 RepID=UPI0013BA4B8D|nr:Ycf66 family protein [Oscillatoria salina]MBZ8179177.1 hypothetical protein [Oscillatoria salina IIICB1]NET88038.1 hypothetical protein [Kamptonema sp. SIO1D9]